MNDDDDEEKEENSFYLTNINWYVSSLIYAIYFKFFVLIFVELKAYHYFIRIFL